MSFYADTSYLFSLYAIDANSVRAVAHRAALAAPLSVTSLNRLELQNAFELAVFQNRMTSAKAKELWQDVQADLQLGALRSADVDWTAAYHWAQTLTTRFTATLGNRSLDVLQIAVALSIGAREFLTFDNRQAALAQAAGLLVRP